MIKSIVRNFLVAIILTVVLLVVLYVIVPPTSLVNTALFVEMQFLRGYPWLPAIILSVALVSLSAIAGLSDMLQDWAEDETFPNFFRMILKILLAVDPTPLPEWAWPLSFITSIALLVLIWFFPNCIAREDVSVNFSIDKGGETIVTLSPGETALIEPGKTYNINVITEPVIDGTDLPRLMCSWTMDVFSDPRIGTAKGCKVDYESGTDSVEYPITLKLIQRRCRSLGLFSFFIQSE